MDEVEYQTKRELVSQYIFSSLMIMMTLFVILGSCIAFNPEEIVNQQIRLGSTFGFFAMIFIMAIMLFRNLEGLFDAIYKLNEGEYN